MTHRQTVGRRWLIIVCCLGLVGAGCGTRLTRAQILSENTTGGSGGVTAGSGTLSGAGANPSTAAGGGSGPGGASASGGAAGTGQAGATGSASGAGGSAATGVGAKSSSGSGTSASGASGPQSAGASGGGPGTPIIVGFIGDLDGFGSSTGVPARDGWAVWTKMINAEGGIHGHPVQLLVGDDGGSGSADVSIAQQFVHQGAIALSWGSTDISGLASYAQAHSVPVIGAVEAGTQWRQDSMLFPEASDATSGVWGYAELAKKQGLTKVASVYCVESPADCSTTNSLFVKDAQAMGLQVVAQESVSLTQPDYTANCFDMRSKGAQYAVIFMDTNSAIRFAQSCSRQGYSPQYSLGQEDDSMGSVSALNGAIAVLGTFPWFLHSGGPGLDEYGQAFQKYDPADLANGQDSQTYGWLSAKVFQQAVTIATASIKATDHLTSQELLTALWSIKGYDVEGLDPGPLARTYLANKPTPEPNCVFYGKLEGGRWSAPDGMTPICQ